MAVSHQHENAFALEDPRKVFLNAVKKNNSITVEHLLTPDSNRRSIPIDTIYNYTDVNNKCALDYAVENNNVTLYYILLKKLYENSPKDFPSLLSTINKKRKGHTPFHLAAQLGFVEFFKAPMPLDASMNEIWRMIKEGWLNAQDRNGNTPFHEALKYQYRFASKDLAKLKAKKQTVAAMIEISELDLGIMNQQGQTPLHMAAAFGYFETTQILLTRLCKKEKFSEKTKKTDSTQLLAIEEIYEDKSKEDQIKNQKKKKEKKNDRQQMEEDKNKEKNYFLKLKDKDGHTPTDIAAITDHQRLYNALYYFQNPKQPKLKSDSSSISMQSLESLAKNINLSEDDFMKQLKLANQLDYKDVMRLIDLRIDTANKNYRWKTLISVVFSSLCPAITAATFLGSLGGFNPEPVSIATITAITFPVLYIPFVSMCYKMRMQEYSNVAKEAMRFNWLATKLPLYEEQFNKELTDINNQLALLQKELNSNTKPEMASALQTRYLNLNKQHQALEKKMNALIEFTQEGKTKLALSYIPRAQLKEKKALGINDPVNNSDWINVKESMHAFISYNTDIFCPLGAGLNIATLAGVLLAKWGVGFLGAGAASMLFGPAAPVAMGIIGTVSLGILIGTAIYKSSFVAERREMGAQNRNLVQAYDSCRLRSNAKGLQDKSNRLHSAFEATGLKLNEMNAEQRNNTNGKIILRNKTQEEVMAISTGYEPMEMESIQKQPSYWQKFCNFFQRPGNKNAIEEANLLIDNKMSIVRP